MAGTRVMRQSKPAFPSAFEDRKKYHSVEGTPGTTPLTHAAHLGDNDTVKRLIASGQRIYVDRLSHDYEAFHRSQRLLRIILAFILGNYLFNSLGAILLEIFFPRGSVTGFLWASVAIFVVFILPVLIALFYGSPVNASVVLNCYTDATARSLSSSRQAPAI
jgi:hypothetical protein